MRCTLRSPSLAATLLGLSALLSALLVPSGHAPASATVMPTIVRSAAAPESGAAPLYTTSRLYSIRAVATSHYVSAEFGAQSSLYGMLRARATTVGYWERFIIEPLPAYWNNVPGPAYAIYSTVNDRFVRAYTSSIGFFADTLVADDSDPDLVATFMLQPTGKDPHEVAILSAANRRYVSAELNFSGAYYGMLRARSSFIGAWERFDIRDAGPSH